jgi:hypothetical protein
VAGRWRLQRPAAQAVGACAAAHPRTNRAGPTIGDAMTIQSSLAALGDLLRERTGRSVSVGFPDQDAGGVHLWPWMVQERQTVGRSATPSRPGDDGRRAARPYAPHLHVIVLVRPELSPTALATLDQVAQAIHDSPIIQSDDKTFGLSWENLDAATLAAVFAAASLRLSLCLSVMIAPLGSQPEARLNNLSGEPADLV